MKWFKVLLWTMAVLGALVAAVVLYLPRLNDRQTTGELALPGLAGPVTVKRDDKGMAYIYARDLSDAVFAQGFVTAQDRLFQMQLNRLMSQGRISELAGEKALGLDRRMRTIGLGRIAARQANVLAGRSRELFERYVAGVNAFIERCPDGIPLEFKLAGIAPEPWGLADSLAILYYMGFSTSANLDSEIVAQTLVDAVGPRRAAQIMPLNINPDDPRDRGQTPAPNGQRLGLPLMADRLLAGLARTSGARLGSNNWAISPAISASGAAMLAGDPHLDPRMLPGVFYPLGLITPEVRAVGANIPGLPGMPLGRTAHIAISPTNNYGDTQDLYVETVDPADPGRYMEGGRSLPFQVIHETLRVRDKAAPGGFRQEPLLVRQTRRGPVVSGLMKGLGGDKVVTLRWSAAEAVEPDLGLMQVLLARDTADLQKALTQVPMLCMNWVFADTAGNIGYRASGRVPRRPAGGGGLPFVVSGPEDNWAGWIPPEQMPHADNPPRGWLGTCNQKTVPADYPYYYSTYFAHSYRYRRLMELLDAPGKKTLDDSWSYQRDAKNLMAERLAPVMARALATHSDTRDLAHVLAGWDFTDRADSAAPAIFQATYINFARLVFADDLGPQATGFMLNIWYFWAERLERLLLEGESEWFDDVATPGVREGADDLLHRAALAAREQLAQAMGDADPESWRWGEVHTLELYNPLRREGFGKALLGTGPMPMGGSGETLYRGWYDFDKPFGVTFAASLRMVADLGDPDKVAAVLCGGVVGRTFSPHQKDQVPAYMDGAKVYWWFSDRAIAEHTSDTLSLLPR